MSAVARFGAEGGGFITVITDLTDAVAGQGPARLLDVVPYRSYVAVTAGSECASSRSVSRSRSWRWTGSGRLQECRRDGSAERGDSYVPVPSLPWLSLSCLLLAGGKY